MNIRGRGILIAILVLALAGGPMVYAGQSHLANAFEALYYYSLRVDDRFPGLDPLATAEDELEKEIATGVRGKEALIMLAILHHSQERWEKAEQLYRQALEDRPDSASIRVFLGDLYRAQSRIDEAVEMYQEALELESMGRAHFSLGMIALENEDHESAAESFRHASDDNEEFFAARVGLGRALYYQDKLGEAAETLEGVLLQDSRLPDAHEYLALIYEEQGKYEQAEHAEQRAAELRNME